MRYRNEQLFDIIHSYLLKQLDQLSLVQLATVIQSAASLFPERIRYFRDYAEELHARLQLAYRSEAGGAKEQLKRIQDHSIVLEHVPDITTYCNLWLSVTCFGVKANINLADEESHHHQH